MITVIIKRDLAMAPGGFLIEGHSEMAEAGKDILCAAVSFLAYTTINSLAKIVGIDPSKLLVREEEAFLELSLDADSLRAEELFGADLLLRSFELGMIDLVKQYSDYIALYYREVTSCYD